MEIPSNTQISLRQPRLQQHPTETGMKPKNLGSRVQISLAFVQHSEVVIAVTDFGTLFHSDTKA